MVRLGNQTNFRYDVNVVALVLSTHEELPKPHANPNPFQRSSAHRSDQTAISVGIATDVGQCNERGGAQDWSHGSISIKQYSANSATSWSMDGKCCRALAKKCTAWALARDQCHGRVFLESMVLPSSVFRRDFANKPPSKSFCRDPETRSTTSKFADRINQRSGSGSRAERDIQPRFRRALRTFPVVTLTVSFAIVGAESSVDPS